MKIMKEYSAILKLLALILSAAAVLCILAANIEAILNVLDSLFGKAKGRLCRGRCGGDLEDQEYEDWDD